MSEILRLNYVGSETWDKVREDGNAVIRKFYHPVILEKHNMLDGIVSAISTRSLVTNYYSWKTTQSSFLTEDGMVPGINVPAAYFDNSDMVVELSYLSRSGICLMDDVDLIVSPSDDPNWHIITQLAGEGNQSIPPFPPTQLLS